MTSETVAVTFAEVAVLRSAEDVVNAWQALVLVYSKSVSDQEFIDAVTRRLGMALTDLTADMDALRDAREADDAQH